MTLRNKKAKGSAAENELVHKFWANEWVCVRVAGSGSSRYPSPDLLASNGDKKLVLEIKSVNDDKKYFSAEQIKDLEFFAEKFGAESWVGVCFEAHQWYFLPSKELDKTKEGNFVIDIVSMKRRGFSFEDMTRGY